MAHGDVFDRVESEVRNYCRSWPTVFATAQGSKVYDRHGNVYLDFFAGAGALNYGHNHPLLKEALLRYLREDCVVHSLDMSTLAKEHFLDRFCADALAPRNLEYKVQFTGPSGTEAVEAAIKLCRKYTGRTRMASFTNAFHGMTLGSLSASSNADGQWDTYLPFESSAWLPYNQFLGSGAPDFRDLDRLIAGDGGLESPAGVIVETVQGEGGLNAAESEWLQELANLCRRRDVLLVVDDVQMGCGRTGPFFSFEAAGIVPDIVCLSKSLSGYGLPLGLMLLRPELDVWRPGEHTSTFRGFNPAFVTGAAAMDFWAGEGLEQQTAAKGRLMQSALAEIAACHQDSVVEIRGRGMAWGLVLSAPGMAAPVCAAAFERGLLMETSGPENDVAKLMPPLTTTTGELETGLSVVGESVSAALRKAA